MSYDEQKRRPGRHHIWFAEMDLDYCRLRYGEGACPAVLGEDSEQKCFNTEATCPVPRAFDPVPKTYRFMQAVENAPIGAGAVPNLTGVSLTPGKIEVGGGLGSRSVVDLTFSDHPGSDIGIDKYLFERGIDQGITSVVNLASAASGSGSLPASAAWALGPILPAADRKSVV